LTTTSHVSHLSGRSAEGLWCWTKSGLAGSVSLGKERLDDRAWSRVGVAYGWSSMCVVPCWLAAEVVGKGPTYGGNGPEFPDW